MAVVFIIFSLAVSYTAASSPGNCRHDETSAVMNFTAHYEVEGQENIMQGGLPLDTNPGGFTFDARLPHGQWGEGANVDNWHAFRPYSLTLTGSNVDTVSLVGYPVDGVATQLGDLELDDDESESMAFPGNLPQVDKLTFVATTTDSDAKAHVLLNICVLHPKTTFPLPSYMTNPCQPGAGYYHPYHGSPAAFIQCNAWGNAFVIPCPANTVYHPQYHVCVHQYTYHH